MPKIRHINIKNFRSILELEMDATDLTVIVGDNDCGKSNILRALNLFFNGETNPGIPFKFSDDYNRFAISRVKRAPEIEVEVDLELPATYRKNNGDFIRWRKRWREEGLQANEHWGIRRVKQKRGKGFNEEIIELTGRSRVPSLLSRIQFEYVPAVRSAEFFQTLRGRIFRVIATASEQNVRQSSGQLEEAISKAVSGLLQDIDTELKDSSRLSLPNDLTPLFRSLDFLAGEKSISLDSRGDGIKARYIPLILKFIAERSRETDGIAPTFIWAYEEPENNLEFRRAQSLADTFYKLAEGELSQVLLTTHSPVFYNMHKDGSRGGLCSAYHLTRDANNGGTEARSALEASVSLDETMGAMAIIAPHIEAAQAALAEATMQATDLKSKLERLNQDNLPTLFVEGQTDYIIFKKLIELFRPDMEEKIFLAEPPPRAGANYVTNMLRSWEFRTKHLPPQERRPSVGIVDSDTEGNGAYQRFMGEGITWKYASLIKLPIPPHLAEASQIGINIPIRLEELWPPVVWDYAEDKGWLTLRPKKGLLSESLLQRLLEEDQRPSDLIADHWQRYFEKQFDDKADNTTKSSLATYIVGLPASEVEKVAVTHLEVLDMALAGLMVG